MKQRLIGVQALWVACLGAFLPVGIGQAQIEGVSYTLTPTYNALRWSEGVGLEDAEVLGGQLGFNLGRYMAIEGFYLGRDGLQTDLGSLGLTDASSQPLVDQELDLRNFGADLVLNLGTGSTVPFLKVGAGVMRFSTSDGDESDQINVRLGGGLRYGFQRMHAIAYVEDSAFRIDRYDLAANAPGDPAFPTDPRAEKIRHNLSAGVGLEFKLGGRSSDRSTDMDRAILRRYRAGLTGVSLPIEVFAGTLDFDEALGLVNQDLLGVRTGIDFGRLVGLRAYFWQGVNSDHHDSAPLQSYGGEMQFNLNDGEGAVPYLLLGAGQLEFESQYRDTLGAERDDKTILILGGGIGFTFGDRLRMDLGARDYLFAEQDLENLSGTEQLAHNWVLTAGLRFSFGRSGFHWDPTPELQPAETTSARTPVTPKADSVATDANTGSPTGSLEPEASTNAMPEASDPAAQETPRATAQEAVVSTDFRGERRVTIPLPSQGELYVRYGQPGGVQVDAHSDGRKVPDDATASGSMLPYLDPELVRQILREELGNDESATSDSRKNEENLAALERRITDEIARQMNERFDALERRIAASDAGRVQSPTNPVVLRDDQPATIVTTDGTGSGWRTRALRLYVGMGLDDPKQTQFGTRLDLGPTSPGSRAHLVPELAFGFGSDATSYLVATNLQYGFREAQKKGQWSPYFAIGAGILGFSKDVGDRSRQEGVLNLSYGLSAHLGRAVGFVEHQGIDLFDLNRLLVGVTWRFGR